MAARCPGNLERKPCKRRADTNNHALWLFGDGTTMFCTRCGSRATERVKLLRQPCPGSPPSDSTSAVLRRLKKGYLPGDETWHGRPTPAGHTAQPLCPELARSRDGAFVEPVRAHLDDLISVNGILGERVQAEQP